MKVRFNAVGARRKALVKAIRELTGAAPRYLGAPGFGYEVGALTIDREGTLIAGDGAEVAGILDALTERGFTGEREDEGFSADVNEPAETANVKEPAQTEDTGLTISMPRESFSADALQNLRALVASKAGLIKKALAIDAVPSEETEERVTFPWFPTMPDALDTKAYTDFIFALCRAARGQKRVTAKEREVTNERYTFRCFLLRLGFIGDEYKDQRRMLLRNLSGNGAFRDGRRKEEAP